MSAVNLEIPMKESLEAAREGCRERGERLRILWDWLSLKEQLDFVAEHPEAEDWFDADGRPR